MLQVYVCVCVCVCVQLVNKLIAILCKVEEQMPLFQAASVTTW